MAYSVQVEKEPYTCEGNAIYKENITQYEGKIQYKKDTVQDANEQAVQINGETCEMPFMPICKIYKYLYICNHYTCVAHIVYSSIAIEIKTTNINIYIQREIER